MAPTLIPLSRLPLATPALVREVSLSTAEAEWLRAIGVFAGQRVTVLRRAAFGGPLHLRTASGGELALDRGLAAAIRVERVIEREAEQQ